MASIFSNFYVNTVTAGVPVVFGVATVQFNCALVSARRDATTENVGNVWIRYSDTGSTGPIELFPRGYHRIENKEPAIFNASQFYLVSATAGDGVLFTYALADHKTFNDIESKVEDAVKQYLLTIGATLDDCSFTSGIDDQERTADNINAYAGSASERIINSGVFDVTLTVTVRTGAGKSGELAKHRLRTAYVRDLLMEPDAEEIIGSLCTNLTVYANSIRDVQCEQMVDGKQWVSTLRCVLTASGGDFI